MSKVPSAIVSQVGSVGSIEVLSLIKRWTRQKTSSSFEARQIVGLRGVGRAKHLVEDTSAIGALVQNSSAIR